MNGFLLPSALYVTSDPYFWPSMAITVIIGYLVGAVIYDGILRDVSKAIVTVFSYAFMIVSVSATRIFPQIMGPNSIIDRTKPLAGLWTIFFVTIFYLIGMWIGVVLCRYAVKNQK